MNQHPYRLTTLPNGVRIATASMPHMRSATVGFWAAIGGRHESVQQGGIARRPVDQRKLRFNAFQQILWMHVCGLTQGM